MNIYCCECKAIVNARLVSGKEIYPHRVDLKDLPFWKCDKCNNHVGCHYKTKERTKPLGVIANKEIKNARVHIHNLIDPFWKNAKKKQKKRSFIYKELSDKLGYQYHTAEIRDIDEARRVYRIARTLLTAR